MRNIIQYIILFILLFIVLYQHNNPKIIEHTTVDTIQIEKPIIVEKLVPDTVYVTEYITDTLYMKDSVKVEVNVPISTYEYSDSLHTIKYKGFKAHIEHLECKGKETIIYKEKVSKIASKQPLFEFKPSVGIGYGTFSKKIDVFIGGSVVFNIP